MSTSRTSTRQTTDYEIRPYRPGDAADVAALYASVWGSDVDADWLDYRYRQNPVLDRTAMIVAADGDRVVGARPYVPFPIRANRATGVGLVLVDLMVHPDHRRRGLFTRMTERVVADNQADATVTMNFANELSAPGYRKLGFTEIGAGPHKDIRVQRPRGQIQARLDGPAGLALGLLGNAATMMTHRIADTLREAPSVRVERHVGIPVDRVTALAAGVVPSGIHTHRTPALYEWIDASPRWRHTTYLATRDGRDLAAMVVAQRTDDTPGSWIVDALPHDTHEPDAIEGLLATVVREHRTDPQITVSGPVVHERILPAGLLRRYGFLPTTNPLLARVTSVDTVFVNRFGDDPTFGGLDVREAANWRPRVHAA